MRCAAADVLNFFNTPINHLWLFYCNRGSRGLCFTHTHIHIKRHRAVKRLSVASKLSPNSGLQFQIILPGRSTEWNFFTTSSSLSWLFLLQSQKERQEKSPLFFLRCLSMLQEARCYLPVKSGSDCETLSSKWYFSRHTGACVHFIYGICGGNDFRTEEECMRACAP